MSILLLAYDISMNSIYLFIQPVQKVNTSIFILTSPTNRTILLQLYYRISDEFF
jgi:hypothetical protein